MTPTAPNAGMNYLKEQAAIEAIAESMLADCNKQERVVMIHRQLYRITAERITDPQGIEDATRQMFGGQS